MSSENDFVETKTPSSGCPNCGKVVDTAAGATNPKEGDITLCINCGGIAKFTKDLTLEPLTEEEEVQVNNNELIFGGKVTTLIEMRTLLRNFWEKRSKQKNKDYEN